MRGERIQIPLKRGVIGPPAKLHLMALVAPESIRKESLNFRGIAMGFYRGWRGWGGGGMVALCPQSSLHLRMHEDYAFVCVC